MTLEEELEKTLSYFEPMSLEMIYIDFSNEFLTANHSYTIEDLELALKSLEAQKKIKRSKKEKQIFWIKLYPKKSILKRILALLKLY